MKLKEWAKQLKADIPAIFIALSNDKTPLCAKVLGSITVVYALSPIDLIPDFIPVLGYLDDLIILPLLVSLTIKFIPKNIWIESREKSISLWNDGKPKKWYYAIPFIVIWIFVVFLIVNIVI